MPIIWRLRLYFEITYFVLLVEVIITIPQKRWKQMRVGFYLLSLVIFSYYPYKTYVDVNPLNGYKYIYQYYPYHTIFDPVKEKRV